MLMVELFFFGYKKMDIETPPRHLVVSSLRWMYNNNISRRAGGYIV
jgi:hypothetical protein